MTAGGSRRQARVNSRAEAPSQHRESSVDGRAGPRSAGAQRSRTRQSYPKIERAGNKVKEKNNRTAEEQSRTRQAKRKRGNCREAAGFPAPVRESRTPTQPSSGSLTGHFTEQTARLREATGKSGPGAPRSGGAGSRVPLHP